MIPEVNLLESLKRKKQLLLENKKYRRQEDLYHHRLTGKYVGDLVYGANDGIVTTFAVIIGAAGASLSPIVVIILGFANIFADGISMGASNFLGRKSEKDYAQTQREKEAWEIENLRELEVEEIRDIYRKKGFAGETLEKAVAVTTANKDVWVETMMRDELDIFVDEREKPLKHALATFLAFIVAGLLPLIPYLIPNLSSRLFLAVGIGGLTLFMVGALRSFVTAVTWIRGGVEMLLIGSFAGIVAFFVGSLLDHLVH